MTILDAENDAKQLISVQTASSSASISFTNLSAAYFKYIIEFDSFVPSATSGIRLTGSINNGSGYISSGYTWAAIGTYGGNSFSCGGSNSAAAMQVGEINSNNTYTLSGQIELCNLGGSQSNKLVIYRFFIGEGASISWNIGGGSINTSSAVNAIKLAMSTGNITSGTFKLYGILG